MKVINDFRGTLAVAERLCEDQVYEDKVFSLSVNNKSGIRLKENLETIAHYNLNDAPFKAKRVFFLLNVPPGMPRGDHAHHECYQYLICLRGAVKFKVHDGVEWTNVVLNKGQGYLLEPLNWIGEIFLDSAVVGVLCSHEFSEDDYIRGFHAFKELFS